MIAFATEEISSIGLVHAEDVLDATVLRVPNTYPAYTGTYDRLNELRDYVNSIPNLFLIGRNGMHRYNNQDHSMLTAMISVDNIIAGRTDKSNIWEVNTEQEYHEQKA
jgi:protoporphyrinogen oxidase